MPLAGDQDDVAGHGLYQSMADGLSAVRLDLMTRAGLPQAEQGIFDNLQWLFTARIVRSQDHKVTSLARRLAHQRALGAIAIAAATKYRNHPAQSQASTRKVAGDGCEVTQCLIGVGVVHHHRERLAAIDFFKPPR